MRLRHFRSLVLAAALLCSPPAQAMVIPAFIHGHNICMVNVNRWLVANGFAARATHSASSLSIRGRGHRRVASRFGAIRFHFRGGGKGHVDVELGGGLCLNPGRHGWQKKPCSAIWHGKPFEIWW